MDPVDYYNLNTTSQNKKMRHATIAMTVMVGSNFVRVPPPIPERSAAYSARPAWIKSFVLLPGPRYGSPSSPKQYTAIEKWEPGRQWPRESPRKGGKRMRKNCNTCEYSKFQRTNEFGESVTLLKGICRRFPPQYTVRGPSWGDYMFPTVEGTDWCGEWKEMEGREKEEEDMGAV